MDETKIKELFRNAEIAELNYKNMQMQNKDFALENARNEAIQARKILISELDKMYKN